MVQLGSPGQKHQVFTPTPCLHLGRIGPVLKRSPHSLTLPIAGTKPCRQPVSYSPEKQYPFATVG
jgi:hypothetical protein